MTRTFLFLAAVFGLFTIVGCGEVGGGGAAPQSAALEPDPPAPQDHGPKPPTPSLYPIGNSGAIEISNLAINRVDRGNVGFSLDYRFVQGTPNPAWTYGVVIVVSKGNDRISDNWIAASGLATQGHLAGNVALADIGPNYSAGMVAVPFIATNKSEIGPATGSASFVSNPVTTSDGAQAAAESSTAPAAAASKPASSGGFLSGLFGGSSNTAPKSASTGTQSQAASATDQQFDPGHIQLLELSVTKNGANSVTFSIPYKFDNGRPNPSVSYVVHLIGGTPRTPEAKKAFSGAALKPEGKFEGEVLLRHPTPPYHATVFGLVTKVENYNKQTVLNTQISDVISDPPGVGPGTASNATTRKKKREASDQSLITKADVGVGAAGKDYGNGDAGLITTPISAYFSARETIEFKIKLANGMKMFKALNDGRNPKSQEEFDEQIIKENDIHLPELPDGQKYVYNPATGELGVRHLKSIAPAR